MLRIRVTALAMLTIGLALPASATTIAETDGERPGTRIEVQQFKRESGGTVLLRLTLINDSGAAIDFNSFSGSSSGMGGEYGTLDGVYLVDLANKKKFEVVRDTDRHCVCTRGLRDIAARSSINLWAKFPAPADGVERLGVVVPHFLPLDDVPLTR